MASPCSQPRTRMNRAEAFGLGFSPARANGADVTIKDTKRYADTPGLGSLQLKSPRAKGAVAVTAYGQINMRSHTTERLPPLSRTTEIC